VETFAGSCGEPGFKDGPEGTNRLRSPELVGVDAYGTLFIFDKGNDYVRMVDTTTRYMTTLLNGACREDNNTLHEAYSFNVRLTHMICYK